MVGRPRGVCAARARRAPPPQPHPARARARGSRGRRRGRGAVTSGARGRERGAPVDRHRRRAARALPAPVGGPPARERRRRNVGGRRGRVDAPARCVHAGVVVAARALRRRGDRERAGSDRAGERARPLAARATGDRLPQLGRHAHRHAHRVPDEQLPARRRGGRHGRHTVVGSGARGACLAAGNDQAHPRVRRCPRASPDRKTRGLSMRTPAHARLHGHRMGRHSPSPRVAESWSSAVATRHTQTFRVGGVHALAFAPDGRLALLRGNGVLLLADGSVRTLFAAPSRLAGLAWSPNGHWLLSSLPAADQWVFVQTRGGHRVLAVSHIRRQFGGEPSLDGWAPGA